MLVINRPVHRKCNEFRSVELVNSQFKGDNFREPETSQVKCGAFWNHPVVACHSVVVEYGT
eukprot:11259902-Ditylum_brightwellii.AAC.1